LDAGNPLETEWRKFSYLYSDPVLRFTGKSYGSGQPLNADDLAKLVDYEAILAAGPDPAADYPKMYLGGENPEKMKPAQATAAVEGRQWCIDFMAAMLELGVIDTVKELAQRLYGATLGDANLVLRSAFLRYYCVKGESSIPQWKRVGAHDSARCYPVHADTGEFTVVLTLPMPNYDEAGGMELEIIDPAALEKGRWIDTDKDEMTAVAEEMMKEGKVHSVKIHPWEYVVMANPLMHRVTSITKGERLTLIFFLGLGN
jgi:hypothetical protein